jgi:hypothetical protein
MKPKPVEEEDGEQAECWVLAGGALPKMQEKEQQQQEQQEQESGNQGSRGEPGGSLSAGLPSGVWRVGTGLGLLTSHLGTGPSPSHHEYEYRDPASGEARLEDNIRENKPNDGWLVAAGGAEEGAGSGGGACGAWRVVAAVVAVAAARR